MLMQPPRPALALLPLELWDIVITFLGNPLVLAHVSRALNERCVRATVEREAGGTRRFGWANARMGFFYSREVLRAVAHYVPLEALPLTDVSVEFEIGNGVGGPGIAEQLLELYHIVAHAPKLQRLTVSLFNVAVHWEHLVANRAMKTLCAVLAVAAARAPGPVIVGVRRQWPFWGEDAVPFTCMPADIAEWELDTLGTSRFNPPAPAPAAGPGPLARLRLRRAQPPPPGEGQRTTLTRCHDGSVARVLTVKPVRHVCWAAVDAGDHRCSLLTLHEPPVQRMGLTAPGESTQRLFGMPLHELLQKHNHLLSSIARHYDE